MLVGVLLVMVAGESVWRPDVVWRPVAALLAVVIVLLLPWRRVHPGVCAAVGFGSIVAVQILSIGLGSGAPVGLTSSACVLLLAYAAARWGSGRDLVLVVSLLVAVLAVGYHRDYRTISEAIAEGVILILSVVIGIAVRAQTAARSRELDRVRASERVQLARELHDAVAHHVSAMVVRAQAGRVVAATSPDAAVEALRVIEEEGSRTLAEMRVLVGALREESEASLTPAASVRDIDALADQIVGRPRVVVTFAGDVDDVHPSVAGALYRIAQESLTNARRHASGATSVSIAVQTDGDDVRLVVRDDGAARPGSGTGYGIVGMTERATLLGGTLSAGPAAAGGWVVEARLPSSGVAR